MKEKVTERRRKICQAILNNLMTIWKVKKPEKRKKEKKKVCDA